MKIVSIHQPNFMPWVPFFEKMYYSDVCVLLGNCQFEKNNFQNRFQRNNRWNTMSVISGNRYLTIKQKEYCSPVQDWNKIKENNKDCYEVLSMFDKHIKLSLYETNVSIIHDIAKRLLALPTMICHDYPTDLTGTARLVDICVRHEATIYLSGPSGRHYLDIKQFEEKGIEVKFFEAESKIDILTCLTEGL